MTQYVSPISFLPEGVTTLSPRQLKLSKNKLLAEFELAGTPTIPVCGKEMSRNDVIRLFDELEYSSDLDNHLLVASDPVLLRFLAQAEISVGDTFSLTNEQITPDFINWVSPFFSWAFSKASLRMFKDICPQEFVTLIEMPCWMLPADEWDAWNRVEVFMDTRLQTFQELNNNKFLDWRQQEQYAGYDTVWLLCNLPVGRFSRILDGYAFEIMRLSITEFNASKRDHAFELLGFAMSLRVSEDMMVSLKNKEKEMRGLVKRNNWKIFRVVLIGLALLSRLATCN